MLRLALRMLARDWRAGELRVLAIALVLAVGSVASVAFFADRVRLALTRDAHQVLGADVLLTADHPWSAEFRDAIVKLGLARAESMTFVSMSRAGGEAILAGVKAVTPGYPLRGALRSAPELYAPDSETREIPAAGSVWLDERMITALRVKAGDTIELGQSRFRVAAVLTLEPDRGVSFMNFAPRVLMRVDDLPATGLVQPQSRINYQLLAAGERDAIQRFEQWARSRLGRGERVDSLENARPEVRSGLDRAQSFLGLAAMLSVVLSAVAIALGTRRYTERHLDGYAAMRCMGATQPQLFALFAWEFLLLAVLASASGGALGYLVQQLVAWWLATLIPGNLPQPGLAHGGEINGGAKRAERRIGADVAGRLGAPDVLLACRQRKHIAAPAIDVGSFADQVAGEAADMCHAAGKNPEMRSAEGSRQSKRLAFSDDEVGAVFAGRFEQTERNRIGDDD